MTLDEVIAIIAAVDPDDFDMGDPSFCIVGHVHKHRYPNSGMKPWSVTGFFAEITGLDERTARLATYPEGPTNPAWAATPQQAIEMLEILRDTGVVDWDIAMQ